MAIEVISAEQAWSSLNKNKLGRWPTRKTTERIDPLATPKAGASFKIEEKDKIFCVGSCFAREVEQSLYRLNYDVLSIIKNLPKSANRKVSDSGIFNKYNVATIYNELQWTLNSQSSYSDELVLIETSNNKYQDYQLAGNGYSDDLIHASAFRAAFNESFQRIKEADVVVLTLGLSEVWFDNKTQLYLNRMVAHDVVKLYPKRFELHVFDYAQSLDYLEKIYQLLAAHLKPTFRVLITVSPVPLLYTFRNKDALVANSYSKAVLRSAVEQFIVNKANVNYFPSYEFASLSHQDAVWKKQDYRHVDSSFVDYIMSHVITEYVESKANLIATHQLAKIIAFYRANYFSAALCLLNSHLNKTNRLLHPELLILWIAILLHIKGSYRNFLLDAIGYLQNQPQNNSWCIISNLLNKQLNKLIKERKHNG